mgnify:CR=1 FL=1
MDESMLAAADVLRGVLLVLLLLAAFALASTADHEEELRHEAWLADLEARGCWVIR